MQLLLIFTVAAVLLDLASCQLIKEVRQPMTKITPKKIEKHGHIRTDNYFWLRDRKNPEVLTHLEAENTYTASVMAHTKPLQKKIFQEFQARIKQTDTSAPYRKGRHYYYTRTEEGQQHPIYCRKEDSLYAEEQVMVDVNQVAEKHDFCSVQPPKISPNEKIMVYAVDTTGRRLYTLHFKNLATGEMLDDVIPEVTGGLAWANDNQTLFYAKQDPETLRSYRIYRHQLGDQPAADKLVFEERDETFGSYVFKTKSEKYILIASLQTLTTEYRTLDAEKPNGNFRVFQPRKRNHEYHIDHYRDSFYIRTNLNAENFRLMKTAITKTNQEHWQEVIPHRNDVLLESFEIFKGQLVTVERKGGLLQIHILPWSSSEKHYLGFDESAYLAYPINNHNFDTPLIRYTYSSMSTPKSVYDYNMVTREKILIKREKVLGGFDSTNYQTERIHAMASNGVQIPISLVYHKDFKKNATSPLLIYGYGSYGNSVDPEFNPYRISLLDRGFVYAIAHIRGGQELGRKWYEDGKLLKKKNTFTDFITCVEQLVKEKYADPKQVFAMGGSAGGLLMGAILNMRPDLFQGVIAKVPWVDVVTTMLDDDIPLTTGEYDEWGNPNEKIYYDYMLSYSPYDQVKARAYPNLLVTTGLHDSQVQYWEPAKWVAKLRAMKTDKNLLLFKIEMEAGHSGASGRYKRYKETAFDYAFLLDMAGISE